MGSKSAPPYAPPTLAKDSAFVKVVLNAAAFIEDAHTFELNSVPPVSDTGREHNEKNRRKARINLS